MEMIVGLSYAAFTHFRHLPLTSEVTFPYAARGVLPSQSREIWGTLWPLFRQLGIRVTHGGASDPAVGGREAAGTATPAGSGPAGGRAGAVLVCQPAADAWDRSPPPRVWQAPTGGTYRVAVWPRLSERTPRQEGSPSPPTPGSAHRQPLAAAQRQPLAAVLCLSWTSIFTSMPWAMGPESDSHWNH